MNVISFTINTLIATLLISLTLMLSVGLMAFITPGVVARQTVTVA